MEHQDYYRALLARDARFDGSFYVAVTSTGIYCRPICRVKTPKPENCVFFSNAAAAESAGYRPCLRCRPELAPNNLSYLSQNRLIQVATCLIAQGYLDQYGCAGLAKRLGVSDRHLRRLFEQTFGVSPIAYAQSQRLLLAKRLLMDTALPMAQIALCAGFGSLRRFNEVFVDKYRLTPTSLRKDARQITAQVDAQRFELSYRAPYPISQVMEFWQKRQIAGLEYADETVYERTLAILCQGKPLIGWYRVEVSENKQKIFVYLSESLLPAVMQVLQLVRRQFDLDADPHAINEVLTLLSCSIETIRVPGAVSGYEVAIRSIIEQVISTEAARRIIEKMVANFGEPVSLTEKLTHLFPTPSRLSAVSEDEWRALGLSRTKARAIWALSNAVVAGELELDNVVDVNLAITNLLALPGIGPWTAGYIALRAWQSPDVFLEDDYVIKKLLPDTTTGERIKWAANFRPWRSYLVFAMWAIWQANAVSDQPISLLMAKESV